MEILLTKMAEFLQETEALIEADDGTVFQWQHIELHEELTDMLKEQGYG